MHGAAGPQRGAAPEARTGGARAGAITRESVQRREAALAERITDRPRHDLREVHDQNAHPELYLARALEGFLGVFRGDARGAIGLIAEGGHDAEDQERHQNLNEREAAEAGGADRGGCFHCGVIGGVGPAAKRPTYHSPY